MECLLARRMVERGVRFVEVLGTKIHGVNRWDAHKDLVKNHNTNARIVDQPIAGLLRDLKSRGLLESTMVVWAGEFGRTPFAEGGHVGRDHSPFGFTIWVAGGGFRGGTLYGATDEFGYHAIENRVEIYDLHATMLHQLGIDHKQLTYRYGGPRHAIDRCPRSRLAQDSRLSLRTPVRSGDPTQSHRLRRSREGERAEVHRWSLKCGQLLESPWQGLD